MQKTNIVGYEFVVLVAKGEVSGFVAQAPGVGGIYEEGVTAEEAAESAAKSACFLLETCMKRGTPITLESEYLSVVRRPAKAAKPIRVRLPTSKFEHTFFCTLSA